MFYNQKFKKLRKYKNLTLKSISKKLEIGYNTLCRWEKGEIIPSKPSIMALAQVLNVSIEEISDKKNAIQPNRSINEIEQLISQLDFIVSKYGDGNDLDLQKLKLYTDYHKHITDLNIENSRMIHKINRQRTFLNKLNQVMYTIDRSFKIKYMNTPFLNFVQKNETEIIGHSISDFFPYREVSEIINIQQKVFEGRTSIKNVQIKLPNNRMGLVSLFPDQYDDENNIKTIIVVIEDITEEIILKKEKDKANKVLELIEFVVNVIDEHIIFISTSDITPKYLFISDSFCKLTGYPKEYFMNNALIWLEHIQTNDRERIKAIIKRDEFPPSGLSFSYTFITKSGEHIRIKNRNYKKKYNGEWIYFGLLEKIKS